MTLSTTLCHKHIFFIVMDEHFLCTRLSDHESGTCYQSLCNTCRVPGDLRWVSCLPSKSSFIKVVTHFFCSRMRNYSKYGHYSFCDFWRGTRRCWWRRLWTYPSEKCTRIGKIMLFIGFLIFRTILLLCNGSSITEHEHFLSSFD